MSRAARTADTHGRRVTLDPRAASRSAGPWSYGTHSPIQGGPRLMGALGGPSSLGRERPGQRGTSPPASSKTKNQEPEARNKEQGRRRTCVLISTLLYPCVLGMVTYEHTRTTMQHELHEHLHPQIRRSRTRGIGLRRRLFERWSVLQATVAKAEWPG